MSTASLTCSAPPLLDPGSVACLARGVDRLCRAGSIVVQSAMFAAALWAFAALPGLGP